MDTNGEKGPHIKLPGEGPKKTFRGGAPNRSTGEERQTIHDGERSQIIRGDPQTPAKKATDNNI